MVEKKEESRVSEKKVDLLPLKSDSVFKRVFGAESHKRVLICLLNAILNGKPKIESIEFDRTEYEKDRKGGKSINLDIKAITDNGTHVFIEIQCKNAGDFIQRANFYAAKNLKEKIGAGEDYNDVPPQILIWITDYNATNRKSCISESVEMFKANGIDPIEVASEKMRKFIIELTKLDLTPKSFVSDMFSIWMQFIKDPASIPDEFLSIPEINEAMKELQYVSHDKEAREEYNARQREIFDFNAAQTVATKKGRAEGMEKGLAEGLEKGLAEGLEKGREEGREEGFHQAKLETAKNLLSMGLPIEQIAKGTGLSVAEIEALKA